MYEQTREKYLDWCKVTRDDRREGGMPVTDKQFADREGVSTRTLRRWRKAAGVPRHPDVGRNKKVARIHRLNQAGLTSEEYREMWREAGRRCEICGFKPNPVGGKPLHIDHDHDTGRVRGLLCRNCNVGLGQLGDNDPETLRKAARYLESRG